MLRLEAEAVPAALDAAHALLARLEVDEVTRTRIAIAVAELVGNVIEHGRTPSGRPPHFVLTLTADAERVAADIEDDGIGFPPRPREVEAMAESGRGIALAHDAVDEVRFARHDERNHWHLVVRRGG
jgi:anti-sigma regulatory factor (Ser/Thr protein kinase)